MPKLKTKKSVRKRFKFTKKGKIKRGRSFRRHILSKKARKRKRALRKSALVSSSEQKMIRRLMPYG
jgi:large subunit ribosomal protein L35